MHIGSSTIFQAAKKAVKVAAVGAAAADLGLYGYDKVQQSKSLKRVEQISKSKTPQGSVIIGYHGAPMETPYDPARGTLSAAKTPGLPQHYAQKGDTPSIRAIYGKVGEKVTVLKGTAYTAGVDSIGYTYREAPYVITEEGLRKQDAAKHTETESYDLVLNNCMEFTPQGLGPDGPFSLGEKVETHKDVSMIGKSISAARRAISL
jgi:hypothetical protein